jgi:DNA-directed RNA polymerase II subunit RPB1
MDKRKLNQNELNVILDKTIPLQKNIPNELAIYLQKKLQKQIRDDLKDIEIYPQNIIKLMKEIKKQYYKTVVDPGESVGVIMAQSIGEKQTQITLNSFHKAGLMSDTVITGVPRFSELLNATKNQKSINAIFEFTNEPDSIEDVKKITNKIVYTDLDSISEDISLLDGICKEYWYDSFCSIYDVDYKIYNNCIRIKLNKKRVYKRKLKISEIIRNICSNFEDIICIMSPMNECILDVFFNYDGEKNDIFIKYLNDELIPCLKNIYICGVKNISHVFLEKIDGKWKCLSNGSNFRELSYYNNINFNTLESNNMWEIYQNLGIEAVRQFLIDEFLNVISSDGSYINKRHISLIVDIMTFTGTITSVSRYGMKREQAGPLAKASFEESLDNFMKAGAYCEIDKLAGCSSCIMLGKPVNVGTGICKLLNKF